MNTQHIRRKKSQKAYALLMVLVMASVSILLYSGAARWTSGSAIVNDRNNTYNASVAAAEGASEQVLAYMTRDFFNQSYDPNRLGQYTVLVPTNDWAAHYEFSDGLGAVNRTYVSSTTSLQVTNIDSEFPGLYGMVYACRVQSNAKPLGTPYLMAAGVAQDIQLASIPVFQFAIFYGMDLEINPGPVMKITGKVHSNANIYTAPVAGLEYMDTVTAVEHVYNNRHPDDPTITAKVAPVYDAPPKSPIEGVSTLTLPIGTNNNPAEVAKIIQVPPSSESPLSPLGKARYYNQCDLVITTTSTNVTVAAGNWYSFAAVVPDASPGYSFVKTNASFYDAREGKNTFVTDVDIAALGKWMTNAGAGLNTLALARNGHRLNSIYVDDRRANASKLTVVRVSNGQTLPPNGLTVATQLPIYVQGNFNAPITIPGSTNTTTSKPSSLVGDAITVLSVNWSDYTNARKTMSQRPALDTTVNAAFLAGIVQTTNSNGVKHYSGGVENFPRFLEDWSGKTLTYNGSMVVLFASQSATQFWIGPGTYYNAPNRQWAFDQNFLNFTKLPPLTPMVRKLVRGQWNVVAAVP